MQGGRGREFASNCLLLAVELAHCRPEPRWVVLRLLEVLGAIAPPHSIGVCVLAHQRLCRPRVRLLELVQAIQGNLGVQPCLLAALAA